MAIYFESLQQFHASGGLKASTITAKQLLPAVVAHMQRMERKFTLQVNGRLPKSMDALLEEVFELCHLQQPFYTQHCASRSSRYMNVSKNRVKIDFTLKYRMSRAEEKWVVGEIRRVLHLITNMEMSELEKVVAVHDYIIRHYDYELQTEGSPFTVYTFLHEKKGVCMAYALLFEKMMEELDIPCFYVVGKADGESDLGHAWNMVQLDGDWYHIDATWNDLGTKSAHHEIRYRYFLRSDEFMKRDHQWNLDHYPPCVSDRFEKLNNVYDAALFNGKLYFPHPKTAALTSLDLKKLVFKKELDIQVQCCTMQDTTLYFSDFSEGGFLCAYNLLTNELEQLQKQKVTRVKSNEAQITVTFETGETLMLEKAVAKEQVIEQAAYEADITVPLLYLGDSWFGSYEGQEACITFESEDGVQLHLVEPLKQVTINIDMHKGLQLNMTSARKDVRFTKPAILQIPKVRVGDVTEMRWDFGQPLAFEERGDFLQIELVRGGKILLR